MIKDAMDAVVADLVAGLGRVHAAPMHWPSVMMEMRARAMIKPRIMIKDVIDAVVVDLEADLGLVQNPRRDAD